MDISGLWVGLIFKNNMFHPFKTGSHTKFKPDISCRADICGLAYIFCLGAGMVKSPKREPFPEVFTHLGGELSHQSDPESKRRWEGGPRSLEALRGPN